MKQKKIKHLSSTVWNRDRHTGYLKPCKLSQSSIIDPDNVSTDWHLWNTNCEGEKLLVRRKWKVVWVRMLLFSPFQGGIISLDHLKWWQDCAILLKWYTKKTWVWVESYVSAEYKQTCRLQQCSICVSIPVIVNIDPLLFWLLQME